MGIAILVVRFKPNVFIIQQNSYDFDRTETAGNGRRSFIYGDNGWPTHGADSYISFVRTKLGEKTGFRASKSPKEIPVGD